MIIFTLIQPLRYCKRICIILLLLMCSIPFTSAQQDAFMYSPAVNTKDYIRSQNFTGSRADINGSMGTWSGTIKKVIDSLRQAASHNAVSGTARNSPNYYLPVQWYPLGPSKTKDSVLAQLGLVSALWVDPANLQKIYAGSNTGGIFATTDGGQNWRPLSDNYATTGVLAIEVDRDDTNHIYIGTGHWGYYRAYGQGVMESFDAGLTWHQTSLNADVLVKNFIVHDLKQHAKNNDTLIAVTNTEFKENTMIYLSPDKGKSWQEVFHKTREELFDVVLTPGKPDNIFAVGSLLLRSRDGGKSWQDVTYRIPVDTNHKIGRMSLALTDSLPGYMLVFAETYDTTTPGIFRQKLYRSVNDGRDFKELGINYIPFANYWKMDLHISPGNPYDFYLGGVYFFKYHTDQDSARFYDYRNHRYHKDVRDLYVVKGEDDDILIMANDGGVSRSDNGSKTWYDITRNGFQATQFYNVTISENSNMMFGGPQDGNLCFYNYDTGEWTKDTHIGDAYDGAIDYLDSKYVYIVGYTPYPRFKNIFLLRSLNGGKLFSWIGVPDTTELGRNSIPLAMHPTNPKTLYVGLKNIWKTTNRGDTWHRISNFDPQNSHKIQALEVSPSNPDVICMSFEDPSWGNTTLEKVMITDDGGQNWRNITPYGSLSMAYVSAVDIAFHPKRPNEIYLALDRNWNDRRIYVTYDMGQSWNNFSQGLPNVPVNALRFFQGAGYDIMFAATDIGVFYRDAFMMEWQLFGEGLPLTIVTDIEINYKRKTLVAGTFGRGLWEAHICLPLQQEQTVINDTITWPEGANVLSDLVLMPGSMVTMTGRIEVGQGRTISVLPGAHLVLDGAELTNNCNGLWEGIKVYGYPDYSSQKPQGKITIRSESVIENAYTGISMLAMDSTLNVIPGLGGGIVDAYRAIFRNNLLAVNFLPAKGANPGHFVLSEFLLTNQPWPGKKMNEFVRIERTNNLEFSSCIFRNEIPVKELPFNDRGIGINAFNASFKVNKVLGDTSFLGIALKPTFYQLNKGIQAIAATPGHYFHVNTVTFKNNYTGAYVSGYDYLESTNCSYETSPMTYSEQTRKLVCGLYVDECPSYLIWDNTFKGPALFGIGNEMTGLVINNCGSDHNMISGNNLLNLQYGMLLQNTNRSTDGSSGARVLNNLFKNNNSDICITVDGTRSVNGIAALQGATAPLPFEPAGNQFSNNTIAPQSDLYNGGMPLIYSHYTDSEKGKRQTPQRYNNTWLIQSVFTIPGDSSHKPDYLKFSDNDIATSLNTWTNIAQSAQEEYLGTLDGGDSDKLIEQIRNTELGQSHDLYKELRKFDSKLSENALIAIVENNDIYNSYISKILANNPVIYRIDTLWALLSRREPPLTDYEMYGLKKGADQFSTIELLKSKADNAAAIAKIYSDLLIARSLSEQTESAAENLKYRLEQEGSLSSVYTLAFANYHKGNYAAAIELLDQAITGYPDSRSATDALIWMLEFEQRLFSNYCDTLTGEQQAMLDLITGINEMAPYARAFAQKHSRVSYEEPYILPGYAPMLPVHVLPVPEVKEDYLKVFPQPANDYFLIEYQLENALNQRSIELVDLTGKVLYHTELTSSRGQYYISTAHLKSGLYILRLMVHDSAMRQVKVLIIK